MEVERPNAVILRSAAVAWMALAVACQPGSTAASGRTPNVAAPDPLNATYRIERSDVTLVNGRSERDAAVGSATKVVTTLADQRATGDVDGDGRPDSVVVLMSQTGGSGTFFYIVALLNPASGVSAAPAVVLGDRIKVSAVRLDGRTIVVDLLDRAAGEPMIATPSVAVTKRFVVDAGALAAR